jgi:hypothetical protein
VDVGSVNVQTWDTAVYPNTVTFRLPTYAQANNACPITTGTYINLTSGAVNVTVNSVNNLTQPTPVLMQLFCLESHMAGNVFGVNFPQSLMNGTNLNTGYTDGWVNQRVIYHSVNGAAPTQLWQWYWTTGGSTSAAVMSMHIRGVSMAYGPSKSYYILSKSDDFQMYVVRMTSGTYAVDAGYPKLFSNVTYHYTSLGCAEGAIQSGFSSIKVHTNDTVHLAFRKTNGVPGLYYMRATDNLAACPSGANYQAIETGDVGDWVNLALDNLGNPHIVYIDRAISKLKYVTSTDQGLTFSTPVVVDNQESGDYGNQIIVKNGVIHISYFGITNSDLKYARANVGSTTFLTSEIDTYVVAGTGSSIALDASDYPHIGYFDFSFLRPKYARWNGSSWMTTYISNDNYSAANNTFTTTVVDSNGYVNILYPTTTPTSTIRRAKYLP